MLFFFVILPCWVWGGRVVEVLFIIGEFFVSVYCVYHYKILDPKERKNEKPFVWCCRHTYTYICLVLADVYDAFAWCCTHTYKYMLHIHTNMIHTYIHACIQIYTYTHTYKYIHTHMLQIHDTYILDTCIDTYNTHAYCTHTYKYIYTHMHTNTWCTHI